MMNKRHSVRVNGLNLSVLESGKGGPTFVFLHFWGGSARTWSDTIEEFGGAYHCVAFDFRGWGDSSKGPLDYGLDALASDTLELVEQLGLRDYVLVGHSMGGKVAQIVATRQPSGLVGLVLVAPAPPTPLPVPREIRKDLRSRADTREGIHTLLPNLAHGELSKRHKELVIQNILVGDPGAKGAWFDSGMDYDLTALASGVRIPIRVVVGGNDGVETEESLRAVFGKYYPHAEFSVIEGSGHLIPLQAPAQLADAISEWAAD